MDNLDFIRYPNNNNIPQKKLRDAISAIENSSDDLKTKSVKQMIINRYYDSNIPLEYWSLKMSEHFKGDPRLLERYNKYVEDLKARYTEGNSICFAGLHGVGKTLAITSILKKASTKGFSCLYTMLDNIVGVMTSGRSEDRMAARRELTMVDFLAIDELDLRFFNQSESSNELFARSLEPILRLRLQNKLPILIGTNSPNMKDNFVSLFKDSLGSLLSKVEEFSIMPGKDFRKEKV